MKMKAPKPIPSLIACSALRRLRWVVVPLAALWLAVFMLFRG